MMKFQYPIIYKLVLISVLALLTSCERGYIPPYQPVQQPIVITPIVQQPIATTPITSFYDNSGVNLKVYSLDKQKFQDIINSIKPEFFNQIKIISVIQSNKEVSKAPN